MVASLQSKQRSKTKPADAATKFNARDCLQRRTLTRPYKSALALFLEAAMNKFQTFILQPDNQFCADCGAQDPRWASTNTGVIVCDKCYGVHRSMGAHISKVISVNSDDWTADEIELMIMIGGNAAANSAYEAYLPPSFRRPGPDASAQERTKFIRSKYDKQEFVKPSLRLNASAPASSSIPKPAEEGMAEFVGLVRVRVVKGTNLAVRDVMSSDPYVVLALGNQKAQTRVIRGSLNPVWDEQHVLSVPHATVPLKLQVFDRDTFSEDDTMGEATVDLQPLYSAVRVQQAMGEELGNVQVGKWMATRENDLAGDSPIWLQNGHLQQEIRLKLRNVESGELELQLEWVPPIQ